MRKDNIRKHNVLKRSEQHQDRFDPNVSVQGRQEVETKDGGMGKGEVRSTVCAENRQSEGS